MQRKIAGKLLVSSLRPWRIPAYIGALLEAGFAEEEIVIVTPSCGHDFSGVAHQAGGLMLCGGDDVEPQRYGESPLAGAGVICAPERDEMEWELLAGARAAAVPVLGICRGLQVINVFLGGTLWQDLPSQRPSTVSHALPEPLDALVHPIEIVSPRHPLGVTLERGEPEVNSRHHQGIRRLAPELMAVAQAPDGLVEACALPGESSWWLRAVQWHPENLASRDPHRALFADFRAAVRDHVAALTEMAEVRA